MSDPSEGGGPETRPTDPGRHDGREKVVPHSCNTTTAALAKEMSLSVKVVGRLLTIHVGRSGDGRTHDRTQDSRAT